MAFYPDSAYQSECGEHRLHDRHCVSDHWYTAYAIKSRMNIRDRNFVSKLWNRFRDEALSILNR